MSCPLCGEVCRCAAPSGSSGPRVRPRFEPEIASSATAPRYLVDPDTYDASEEQFAASLERSPETSARPKFVVEQENASPNVGGTGASEFTAPADIPGAQSDADSPVGTGSGSTTVDSAGPGQSTPTLRETDIPEHDPSFWKQAVAARVDSYRARRKPRPPKYPSLRLKFEPGERCQERGQPASSLQSEAAVVMQTHAPNYEDDSVEVEDHNPVPSAASTESARIIEFPRFYGGPVDLSHELAEPVMNGPRIVEAPEVEPPPPALGGIIIEPEEQETEKRPGFEIPLQTAPLARRLWSGALDGLIVLIASTLFGYIFFRITRIVPPLTQLLGMVVALTALFWAGYQYLLLTYTASTPGLRLAGLELYRFDGSPVPRDLRRWRVLASILSALSLGLGFAWCFLDEDALCWHDRITHTYLAPDKGSRR